jgi:hypothetical protein
VRIGAYPGTFDPPTIAHLAIAEAALHQGGLDAVHLVVSREPLGKAPLVPTFEDRISVLEAVASSRAWLEVRVTAERLIADVVADYDAVVMGMDKWLQVVDPAWYGGSRSHRDRAVTSLPEVLLAARDGVAEAEALPPGVRRLDLDPRHGAVASSLVRTGRREWMLPEAAAFDARTSAWSDPAAYARARGM